MSNGQSDVRLLDGQVKIEAWDLCVDSKDRRKNDSEFRRALVHDFDDGLTINWNYDYPGGVTIRHLRRIFARGKQLSAPNAVHLAIDGNTRIEGRLEVDGNAFFEKTVEFVPGKVLIKGYVGGGHSGGTGASTGSGASGMAAMAGPPPVPVEIDLSEYIMALHSDIEKLKARLASVQENWRWCKNCEGLFFAGHATKGVCPAGGEHTLDGSGSYSLLK